MPTKKTKKKVIDGVTKPKKASTGTKKPAPFATEPQNTNEEPVAISVEDTAVAITIDDPDDQGTPVGHSGDIADAIENDTKISEPAIEDGTPNTSNSADEALDDATSEAVDDVPAEDNSTDEGLVSSAILEESVIDKNLDDLINDIENQDAEDDAKKAAEEAEKAEAKAEEALEPKEEITKELAVEEAIAEPKESEEPKELEEPKESEEPADAAEGTVEDAISNEDKAAEKAINAIKKQEKKDPASKKQKRSKAKKSKPKATAKPFRIISRILALITTGAVAALGVRVATTGIFPTKYLVAGFAAAAIVLFFILFKAFRNKTRVPMLVVVDILSIVLTAASIFGFVKIDETMAFLNRNFTDDTEYSIYDVIVSKQSNYNNLNDVKGKTFHSISDFVDTERLEEAAREQASATIAYESGVTNLLDHSLDSTTYISVVNSGTYEATLDNDESNKYRDGLKIIGELKVKIVRKNDISDSDLTKESSIIYLSGIDTRSGEMLDRSLSDVNIVITMNPKTKEILMTTIPRDYYVQLHGTSGLPDKLTHAGALGGVQLSMDTIDDLLGTNFNRYVRVNFNFVINLVNAIGGITIYSDVDYDIKAWTNNSCVFHPGYNDVDGDCALAFARERYAYSDGDRHRGRNQEQVIEKIFEKVTSSSTLISHYSAILDSLNGSFDTDISTSDITSLANMQLSDMATWTINEYNLDGNTGSAYTYSYPSQKLSVMFPNQETVDTAKQKIQQVFSGTSE